MSTDSEVKGRLGKLSMGLRRRVFGGAADQSSSVLARMKQHKPINQAIRNIHISLRNKMIFLPIGKVANSSIKAFLYLAEAESLGLPRTKKAQPTARTVHNPLLGPLIKGFQLPKGLLENVLTSDKYFRFAFVRNPYDRLLSCFLDRVSTPTSGVNRVAVDLAKKQMGEALTFEEFVMGLKGQTIKDMNPHWRPQYYEASFDCLKYSFVGHFETLEKDLTYVISKVYGPDAVKSLHLSENYSPAATSARSRLKEYYTDRTLASVNEIYDCDFKEFGYKKVEKASDFDV